MGVCFPVQILLSSDGEELVHVDGVGCFGQEVLVGMRRRMTAVAYTSVECLNVEKDDLLQLFKQGIGSDLRRICMVLLDAFMARERLRSFGTKLRISFQKNKDPRVDAACVLQLMWRRFCDRDAAATNELYKLISKFDSRNRAAESKKAGATKAPKSLGAPSSDINILAAIGKLAAQQDAMQASINSIERKMAPPQK